MKQNKRLNKRAASKPSHKCRIARSITPALKTSIGLETDTFIAH